MKVVIASVCAFCLWLHAARADELAQQLAQIKPEVLSVDAAPAEMLYRDLRRRLSEANQQESAAWQEITSADQWQRYAQPRIAAMKKRLGIQPSSGPPPDYLVTGRLVGDGYEIQNLVYQAQAVVTANLYLPSESRGPRPAILIVHSHHAPKTQGELQDMGITWARQGAVVLVIDLPGHGERRQHRFVDESSYPRPFRTGRQDYYFRYNLGQQLPLVGSSLMGWMVNDLRRGIDLVVSLPGVDKSRIAMLGAVAGGGDPCAVTAAVDERITLAAPFNFGGPQPETRYPLPDDAETSFNYAGSGSWESTRNLQSAASEGYLPWVIVGSRAPRGLVYGHEFSWDQPRDPVWKRLEKIYGFYNARDRLSYATGRGRLSGQPPEATHCTNIGPVHRERIHLALRDWFNLPVAEKESSERRPAAELHAWTEAAQQRFAPQLIHEIVAAETAKRTEQAASHPPTSARDSLIQTCREVLGDLTAVAPRVVSSSADVEMHHVSRVVLETEPGIQVPLLLLLPDTDKHPRPPVAIGLAQSGKKGFLTQRADAMAQLLDAGTAICLPDVRGTGETSPGEGRGRTSSATSLSASAWMLGQTMLGWRLKDLRSVCRWLESRGDVDATRLVLWGESFTPANDPQREFAVPWDAEDLPTQSEPLGAHLALLGALFEDNVRGVYGNGGLESYRSLLASPYLYVPHDALVPRILSTGGCDLDTIAAKLGPRLRWEAAVDGMNRRTGAPASSQAALAKWLHSTTRASRR